MGRRNGRRTGWIALLLAGSGLPGWAAAIDVFNTAHDVPSGPAYPLMGDGGSDLCRHGPVTSPLPLFEAIERSLCESPKTRSAWAGVKSAAAGLGAAKSAYLPTLSGTADYGRSHDKTTVDGPADLNTNYAQNTNTETLQLAWVLYDFGGRSASIKSSRESLLAAQANQNVVLQAAFATTAKDYYAAQAANAKVASTRYIETSAQKNLDAAAARYKTGIAPITDKLQANTAFAQAVFERASAEGAYQSALGTLAIDMSLPPDQPLTLPSMDEGALPDARFVRAVHELLDEATQTHPSVLAAKAQWQVALANVDITRALGLPSIGIQGTLTHQDQPLNQTISAYNYPSHTTSSFIGINLTVPLFEGFGRQYKIQQAKAEADVQEQAFRDAVQQVSIGVWSGVQTLQTDTENLKNTQVVLDSARATFEAASQRYQAGVGNILELLSSQSTLSGAELQQIQAQLEWRGSRLQLAAGLGQIGMWAIK